ncbi:MAG: DUF488 domain-containing protein [Acidobacteriota bacterium]|nr:DUF488 domain-containing protein [Acidobacteriota bacterium]
MLNEQSRYAGLNVWTIGHSTRSAEKFLGLLVANQIEVLADIRRFAASRKYPHFNQASLQELLEAEAGIEYAAFPELGGRRRPRKDSPNTIWRSESFRGYADYMETEEFRKGIERLSDLARRKRAAVMCSEAVWWRCHRALVADYLKSRGAAVYHIVNATGKTELHPYTSAARLSEGKLSYSPAE